MTFWNWMEIIGFITLWAAFGFVLVGTFIESQKPKVRTGLVIYVVGFFFSYIGAIFDHVELMEHHIKVYTHDVEGTQKPSILKE